MPIFSRPFFHAPAAARQRAHVGAWRNQCRPNCSVQQLDMAYTSTPAQGGPTPSGTEGLQSPCLQVDSPSNRVQSSHVQDVQHSPQYPLQGIVPAQHAPPPTQPQQGPIPPDPAAVTHQIKCASSLRQLQHILQQHRSQLNCIHVVAALQAVLKLHHPLSPWPSLRHMPYAWQRPPKCAAGPQPVRPRRRAATQPQGTQASARTGVATSSPHTQRQLLTREQSIARQQAREKEIAQQEACARQRAYSVLSRRQEKDQQLLAACMVQFLVDQAEHQLSQMQLKEVIACFNCLVQLPVPPNKKYFIMLMVRAEQLYQHADTNLWAMSQLLHCIANAGMQRLRQDWGKRFYAAVSAKHEQMDVRSTTRILHATVRLKQQLPVETAQQLVDSFCRHVRLADPRDISLMLWAIIRLRLPADQHVVNTILAQVHRLASHLDGRELSLILWSLSCLHMQQAGKHHYHESSSEVACHSISSVNGHNEYGTSCNGDSWGRNGNGSGSSCCVTGSISSSRSNSTVCSGAPFSSSSSIENVSRPPQQSLPCTLGGEAWRTAAVGLAAQQLPLLQGHSLALMVYALSRLQWHVNGDAVHKMLAAVQQERFPGLRAQGMALLIHGVVQLGHCPDSTWLAAFRGRLNSLDGADHQAVQTLVTGSMEVIKCRAASDAQLPAMAATTSMADHQCHQIATMHAHAAAHWQFMSEPSQLKLHDRPDRFLLPGSIKSARAGKQSHVAAKASRQVAPGPQEHGTASEAAPVVVNGNTHTHRQQQQQQQHDRTAIEAAPSQPVGCIAHADSRHVDIQQPEGHELLSLLQPAHHQLQHVQTTQLTALHAHRQVMQQPARVPLAQTAMHHPLHGTEARPGLLDVHTGVQPAQQDMQQQDGIPLGQQDAAVAAQLDTSSVCCDQPSSAASPVSTQQLLHWAVGQRKEGDFVDRLKAMCPV